jgi:hypothetical protein
MPLGHDHAAHMKRIAIILLLLIVAPAWGKARRIKYDIASKGLNTMVERLIPDVIVPKHGCSPQSSLPAPNTFASYFEVAPFTKDGDVVSKPVVDGFPTGPTEMFPSDGKTAALWGRDGRGLRVVDMDTKKTADVTLSSDGNVAILGGVFIDPQTKLLLVQMVQAGPSLERSPCYHVIFDVNTNQVVDTSKPYEGELYPYAKGRFLWCEFLGGPKVHWHWCDLQLKVMPDNKLTKALTNSQIITWRDRRPYHFEKRRLIGYVGGTNPAQFFLVRWAADFGDVTVTPMTSQCPDEYIFSEYWTISPDGDWAATSAMPLSQAGSSYGEKWEIVFYRLADAYPQGISPPIFGGLAAGAKITGAFVNHSEWGPIYLDEDADHPGAMLVYHLNQGLEILRAQAGKALSK